MQDDVMVIRVRAKKALSLFSGSVDLLKKQFWRAKVVHMALALTSPHFHGFS